MKDGYEIAAEQIEQFKCFREWEPFIAKIRYKYDFEDKYDESNVNFIVRDCWEWDWDWCEGQTDVIVVGLLPLNDIPEEMFLKKDEAKKGENNGQQI